MNRDRLTKTRLSDLFNQNRLVLADFCAEWAPPCHAQLLVINHLTEQYGHRIVFEIVDVDEDRELAKLLRITSIPTLIFFRDGREVKRFVGLQKAENLLSVIQQEPF